MNEQLTIEEEHDPETCELCIRNDTPIRIPIKILLDNYVQIMYK